MKYFVIVVQIFLSLCSHPLPAFWSVTIQLTNSGSPLITEICVINDDQDSGSSLSPLLQSLHTPELTSHFLSTCLASVEPEPNNSGGVVTWLHGCSLPMLTDSVTNHSLDVFIFSDGAEIKVWTSYHRLGGTSS